MSCLWVRWRGHLYHGARVLRAQHLEPGILLLEKSAEKYTFITQWSLEFLDAIAKTFHPRLESHFRQSIYRAAQCVREKNVVAYVIKLKSFYLTL